MAEIGGVELATPDAVLACENYISLATEAKEECDQAQQIGCRFASRVGAPEEEECILAGGAIFTAVLGGTMGLLMQQRLRTM